MKKIIATTAENSKYFEAIINENHPKFFQAPSRKMFDLNIDDVLAAILMNDNYSQKHPLTSDNKIADLKEFECLLKDDELLGAMPARMAKLNNGNIDPKYLDLATLYAILSTNPISDQEPLEKPFIHITAAIAMMHTAHWIICDLIDNCRDMVRGDKYKEYAETLTSLFLSALDDEQPDEGTLDEQYEVLESTIVENDETSLKNSETIKGNCELARKGLHEAWTLLKEHINANHLSRCRNGFKEAVTAFRDKMSLQQKDDPGIDTYLENRQKTSGCRPYMALKYYVVCQEHGIDLDLFHKFMDEHSDRIKEIEWKVGGIIGMCNDTFGIYKDDKEGSANGVYILSKFEKKSDATPVIDSKKLWEGLEKTRAWIREIYLEIGQLLGALSKDPAKKPFIRIITQVLFQEMYAISIFSFYSPRYQKDAELVRLWTNKDQAGFIKKHEAILRKDEEILKHEAKV